jgi:hypothetical protein
LGKNYSLHFRGFVSPMLGIVIVMVGPVVFGRGEVRHKSEDIATARRLGVPRYFDRAGPRLPPPVSVSIRLICGTCSPTVTRAAVPAGLGRPRCRGPEATARGMGKQSATRVGVHCPCKTPTEEERGQVTSRGDSNGTLRHEACQCLECAKGV